MFDEARYCAVDALSKSRWEFPLDPNTFYFWSPQSMVPPGRVPYWASNIYAFTVPGVDPNRFVFGMDVSTKHPFRGNYTKVPRV